MTKFLWGSRHHALGGSPNQARMPFFIFRRTNGKQGVGVNSHITESPTIGPRHGRRLEIWNYHLRLWRYPRGALTNHHEPSRLLGLGTLGRRWHTQRRERGQGKEAWGGAVLCEMARRVSGTRARERQWETAVFASQTAHLRDSARCQVRLTPSSPRAGCMTGVGAIGMPIGQDQQVPDGVSDIETDQFLYPEPACYGSWFS